MNGIFGGFLAIIDSIGGGFLYILVGGAASKTGGGARLFRMVLGSLLFGVITSVIIYLVSPEQALQRVAFPNNFLFSENSLPMTFIPPVVALIVTAMLELLRFTLEPRVKRAEAASGLRITPSTPAIKTDREATKQAA